MSSTTTKKRAFRIGAGVAALVGLGLAGTGAAQAAPGFDPGSAESRIGGSDRYATAALIAQQSWTTASTVIVANGETNGIDALSASYLAGVVDAPILLTQRDAVPTDTAAAIAKLNPSKVIVIGGEPSVSAATYAALTAGRTAERIAGADRYETATKIVEAGMKATTTTQSITSVKSVFIARGDLYGNTVAADALAASPVAFRGHVPVLLVEPDAVPASTLSLLKSITPTSVFAIGDTKAVSSATEQALRTELSLPSIGRLQGSDRTETAAAIANSQSAKDAGFTKTAVGIANGYKVDALAAGPAAGKGGYPLLLTESATSLGSGTQAYLAANKNTLASAKVFGDATSVSTTATEAARSTGGGTTTPPVTTTPGGVVTPVAVTAEILPIHVGDTSFTVQFSGPVQASSIEASDFAVNSLLRTRETELDTPVYHPENNTATVTLKDEAYFRSGQSVIFTAKSVLAQNGAESPLVEQSAAVTAYTVIASLYADEGGDVLIGVGPVPAGLTVEVVEIRGGTERTTVNSDQERELAVLNGVVSFARPAAPGLYTYEVSYLNGNVIASNIDTAAGDIRVAPEGLQAASVTGTDPDGIALTVSGTLGDGTLSVQQRRVGTTTWADVDASPTIADDVFTLPRSLAGRVEYRVAVSDHGATSSFTAVTGTAETDPLEPGSLLVSDDVLGARTIVTPGRVLASGETLEVRYDDGNGWSETRPADLVDAETNTYAFDPLPVGAYQVQARVVVDGLRSGWSDSASLVVAPSSVPATVVDLPGDEEVQFTLARPLAAGQTLVAQVRTGSGNWVDASVPTGSGDTFTIARPVDIGEHHYQLAVQENGAVSAFEEAPGAVLVRDRTGDFTAGVDGPAETVSLDGTELPTGLTLLVQQTLAGAAWSAPVAAVWADDHYEVPAIPNVVEVRYLISDADGGVSAPSPAQTVRVP